MGKILNTLVLCVGMFLTTCADAKLKLPICIGAFCIGKEVPSIKAIGDLYGNSKLIKDLTLKEYNYQSSSLCYYDDSQKIYIKFVESYDEKDKISDIYVTKENICGKSMKPKRPFMGLVLNKCLKMNDIKEQVVKCLGKPDLEKNKADFKREHSTLRKDIVEHSMKYGDSFWSYGETLDRDEYGLTIHFNNNRVSAIHINKGP